MLVAIDGGRTLRLITNDLQASAERIGELYKARWQIELFFRWIKQHLKIKRFLGTSENAIRIQIAVALIAFLILSWPTAPRPSPPACSPSPGSSGPTSCTADPLTISKPRHPDQPRPTPGRTRPMLNRTAVGLPEDPSIHELRSKRMDGWSGQARP